MAPIYLPSPAPHQTFCQAAQLHRQLHLVERPFPSIYAPPATSSLRFFLRAWASGVPQSLQSIGRGLLVACIWSLAPSSLHDSRGRGRKDMRRQKYGRLGVRWSGRGNRGLCEASATNKQRQWLDPQEVAWVHETGRTHWIEAIGVSEGIVITFLQFQALKSCLARAKPWQRLGTYGTPEFGVVASCDDSALWVGTKCFSNRVEDVNDLLAKLWIKAILWRLCQCDNEDVAMALHREVFGRWNAIDCHATKRGEDEMKFCLVIAPMELEDWRLLQ